jgi:hypothetical protein
MRKSIADPGGRQAERPSEGNWLDIPNIASVEVTSEDPEFPIESAFGPGTGNGWRAGSPGPQRIRLKFDQPRSIHRIQLEFVDSEERTQEFTLGWEPAGGAPPREIVRQQWNFSPAGSTREQEDYRVDLRDVSALELTIRPNIGGGEARARLTAWRVG